MSIENNLQYNINLSKLSTIGVGGIATLYLIVSTKPELEEAIAYCRTNSYNFKIIGQGSNILFSEGTYTGVIVKLANDYFETSEISEGKIEVVVDSGYSWDEFVWEMVCRGFSGLETLAGIPGTVGAAPIQNIGAYGREVAEVITKVEVYDTSDQSFKWLSGKQCEFKYRDSIFKSNNRSRYVIWSY